MFAPGFTTHSGRDHRLQFSDGNQTTFSTLFCFRYSYLHHRIVFDWALFLMKTLIMCAKDKLLIVLHVVVMSKKFVEIRSVYVTYTSANKYISHIIVPHAKDMRYAKDICSSVTST